MTPIECRGVNAIFVRGRPWQAVYGIVEPHDPLPPAPSPPAPQPMPTPPPISDPPVPSQPTQPVYTPPAAWWCAAQRVQRLPWRLRGGRPSVR